MTPGKFLRLLWPDTGLYCIAHPFKPANSTKTVYRHHVFPTISEAVSHVHAHANLEDVYFAVLSLEQEKVWDPDKEDHKTGQKGAWAVRKQSNMLASKALFFDLDVGAEPTKYPTQRDALVALAEFLGKTALPVPTLVSSGGGVHVYWHMTDAVDRETCRTMQWHMRQLAEGTGLKPDPQRTTDMSSVLRVPDTFNWKDRANPRPVKMLGDTHGAITPPDVLKQLISDAMVRHGIVATDAPVTHVSKTSAPLPAGFEAQTFNDFGPPPTLEELGDACAQVREMIRSQLDKTHPHHRKLEQTAWYRGMICTLRHVENGEDLCRKLTAIFPRTTSDIEAKLHQSERYAPAKCETLQDIMPWKDAPCQGCRFRDKVPNPFAACRKSTLAPPPGAAASAIPPAPGATSADPAVPPAPTGAVQQLVAPNPVLAYAAIPNPPKPFERLKTGEVAVVRKDKDGNETTTILLRHDLYPLKRLANEGEQREQHTWRATLPRGKSRDFTIDADVLYDVRKFTAALSHNGVYPNKADLPALQDYMVAYISQLQKSVDADTQTTHLGWTADRQQFILPEKTLCADGTIRTSSLSLGAERAAQHIRRMGDPNVQRDLMKFYAHREYLANQFVLLCSLASILFEMTGHHGIVVNCSGAPGASKSTTLYTSASYWGDPILWPINGTNRGATANARMQRMATNANLPTCVDEITHIPVREAQDLVMGVSQPGHRLRLDTGGVERKQEDGFKSSIMISTANSSLHSLLSTDNAAGTAGSMRVFEIMFTAKNVHSKAEADEFLRQIKQHYGWIGEIFAQFVVRNYAAVSKRVHAVMQDVDVRARILSSERFYSGVIAAVYVAAEIAEALKLLPYVPDEVLQWAIDEQMPHMRGIVREEYRDPLALLTDYIAEKQGNIVVVDKTTGVGANTSGKAVAAETAYAVNTPHGALLGHYDLKTKVLYLLKQGFKDYCAKVGASASRMLEDLNTSNGGRRIVVDRNCRRTLGAGTDLAKGQTYCFAVDMTHPDIAGVVPTLVTSGGTATGAATGNMQVVK